MTNVWTQGINLLILLVMNYTTLLDDPNDTESLSVTFEITKHREIIDIIPRNLGSDGYLYVDE